MAAAYEEGLVCTTKPANTDLSAKQFYFVAINSSGYMAVAGAGDADGVLQNKPSAQYHAASWAYGGITKVVLGGTVAIGARVTSDSSGKCVTAGSGEITLGLCLVGGDSGDIGTILLQRGASVG